jgi:hypothetical protein
MPLDSTQNARILEWRRRQKVKSYGRIIHANGWRTRSKSWTFSTILPHTRPLTSMTSHNHDKILRNYKSVICKTLKWTNIIEMKEMSWCKMCICQCVFGSLIMAAWWVMHFKFSFKNWQMKVMFAWIIAAKREP